MVDKAGSATYLNSSGKLRMPKNYKIASPESKNQGGGYVLWPIIVGSLVIVIGAVGILARSSSGQFGALFSVEAREAKDAAESGIEEVMASMNSPENRGTLVASRDPSKWWAGAAPANPCAPTSPSTPLPKLKNYYQATGSTSNAVAGSSPSAGDSKLFYIFKVSIKSPAGISVYERNNGSPPSDPTVLGLTGWSDESVNKNIDHAGSINLLASANTGLISVSAAGYSRRPDGTYVRSIVTKEYEIVPKCCGRSFGNVFPSSGPPVPSHGFDSRGCRSGENGIGELGFIIGVDGDGLITKAAGKSLSLYESNSEGDLIPSDQILTQNPNIDCSLAANEDQCRLDNQALQGKTSVSAFPIDLDPLPANPVTNAKGCIRGNVTLDTKSSSPPMEGLSANSSSYCPGSETLVPGALQNGFKDVGAPSGKKGSEKCTGAGTQYLGSAVPLPTDYILNASGNLISSPVSTRCYVADSRGTSTTLNDYCVDNALLGTVDCSIGYISLTSGSLTIDTTAKKVRLFLYDSAYSGVGGVNGGEIKLTGGGTINHTYNGNTAGLGDSDRLAIYGNLQNQIFSFGGTSLSLAAQIYLPYGTLDVGGTTELNGILWTNNLSLRGDLTINTPPASAICKVIAGCYPEDPNKTPIVWDWVARSPNATSLF
ncbi:hypothetical protein KBY71_09185 [Cyanobium sp. T1B-Tous]|uniref:hypothetical protein n=1 Tax=Cyanobium sp. T1B-Tous TaxID=2823721 RepID=UPI0020CDCDFB|nr:hypothetical protein [Cyanobium sp. T1B-Tous]MCP9806686.1 hypothetical protein [Cyanobium sp. T1B-Tous]